MSFQIDSFQADAFQSEISDSPFIIPMNKQRTGSRVLTTGTILRYKATVTGEFSTVDIWINGANSSATSIIFNVEINGDAVFSGGDRPTIATGASHVQKTNVGEAVTLGDDIEITIEQVPTEGVGVPIDSIIRVLVS
jgi:hypothetical protein